MDELEERRQLDRLIEEQEKDDSGVIYPEASDQVSLSGLENSLAVDEDGELIDLRPRDRGTVLVGGADWHGTIYGYARRKCKCLRCRGAKRDYEAERRAKQKEATGA
jgi:hypothetical protein